MLLSRTSRFSRLSSFRTLCDGKGRTTTDLGQQVKAENVSSDIEGHRPMYAKKVDHQSKIMEQRFKSVHIDSGHRPTKWQRRFLVITKLYNKQSEIPEIVANGTMNRMHDRMRVVFIITACFGFFIIFALAERMNASRIDRDKASGKVVTSM